MAVVKYKVPSQAASGAQTFADQLVGNQITDGTSQLTNTNFAFDKIIPEKDSKTFSSSPFSDFFNLDNLKEETNSPTTQDGSIQKNDKIKFKGNIDDAAKSLFGSLNLRLQVAVTNIIKKFPAALYIDAKSPTNLSIYSLSGITYSTSSDTTTFNFSANLIYNPFDIAIITPSGNTTNNSDNLIRDFYNYYTKYVLDYNGLTYDVLIYLQPNSSNIVTIQVKGKPFTGTTTTDNFLIRPNDGITEEFFNNTDDLETLLLNRETKPKYQASFKVPRESLDTSKTEIISVNVNWPTTRDGWNLQIVGLDYTNYINKLSDLATEIDEYKSNLVVRFMTAPQLYEFDSIDQKAQSLFQLYGQAFDNVKKFIDNIAFMRNVSYDGVNNIPDVLLKNLSQTLGLSTVNLFDEKSLQDTLYTRQKSVYDGLLVGKTLIEAEYEFYRRLLVNLAHLYKSKGTRKGIDFLLKFLGAPEQLIEIDEYVYDVVSLPQQDFEYDIYDLIQGTKKDYTITGFTTGVTTYDIINDTIPTGYSFSGFIGGTITSSTNLSRDEYPIDSDGLPRKVTNTKDEIYFQKGAGWNELTTEHRSGDIIDTDLSSGTFVNGVFELTGRTKTIITKPKPFTYGEEYFDYFRTLPNLDYGFEITSRIDNQKINITTDENSEKLVLNRKNLNVYLSPSQGAEYDIYRKSRNLKTSFGNLLPQTGVTYDEYIDNVLDELIPNTNSVKYEKTYTGLTQTFNTYITNTGFTSLNFVSVNAFVNKISPYWVKVVEQFIPATTLWTGGNLIKNTLYNRSKYTYLKPNRTNRGSYGNYQ